MAKQSHLPTPSQPEGSHSPERGSSSPVGYGRPPVHTRFKPGQSGNPKGRRKGQRNLHTVLTEALNQRITIREGDRTRSVTKLDGRRRGAGWRFLREPSDQQIQTLSMLQMEPAFRTKPIRSKHSILINQAPDKPKGAVRS